MDSISLRTQIRIAATQRRYDPPEQERLRELFGEPHQWKDTLRSLLWTNTNTIVPRFSGGTVVRDARYLHLRLRRGRNQVLRTPWKTERYRWSSCSAARYSIGVRAGRLQAAQISWEKEAKFRLPVRLWREMMDHYFPNSAWLRLRKDTFDRLYDYRSRNALLTWERTLESLLNAAEKEVER